MTVLEARTERISTRVTARQKKIISHAANLRGRSLTDFMLEAAQKEAEKAIDEVLLIRVATKHQQNFIDALSNPPLPNDALKEAMQDYKKSNIISK